MRASLLSLCAAALFATANTSAHAVALAFQPASQSVAPGDVVVLDLVASGFEDSFVAPFRFLALGDYDLDIAFDPAALRLDGYTLSDALGDFGLGDALDFSLGEVASGLLNLAVVSLIPPLQLLNTQPDAFALASLAFTVQALSPGASTAVEVDAINAFGGHTGGALAIDTVAGAVLERPGAVGAVPEPTGLMLVGLGLASLIAVGRAGRGRH